MKYRRILIFLIVVVTLTALAFGTYYMATYETANHANRISTSDLLAYNTTITARAYTADWISQDMVLVLHSLHKYRKTDSQAVFYIYQLPEGADPDDYLSLRASQIREEDGLVHMGTLSCRLPADNILSAYDFQLSFIR